MFQEQVIAYAVPLDVAIDLVLIFAVIAQGIEDLSHVQVRQVRRNFLRRHSAPSKFHDGADGCSCSVDDRLPTQDLIIRDHVAVLC